MASLAGSLKKSVLQDSARVHQDARLFSSEYTSNYPKPQEKDYWTWKDLPDLPYKDIGHTVTLHQSSPDMFARLESTPQGVIQKLAPALPRIQEALEEVDPQGSGYVHQEQLVTSLRSTGIFLSGVELQSLLRVVPRDPHGLCSLAGLKKLLEGTGAPDAGCQGEGHGTGPSNTQGRPSLPPSVSWPDGQEFPVQLRKRPGSQPFVVSASLMSRFATLADRLVRQEQDPEKVHALLRHEMLRSLLLEPGRQGQPDLSFRDWLAAHGALSCTMRQQPGPVPPEVYDLFDQIVYQALSIPPITPLTQTPTALGGSMKRSDMLQPATARFP